MKKIGQLDRRVLRRTEETLVSDVSLIASEFLAGFQAVQRIDRPAVSIFGSARVLDGTATYGHARATGKWPIFPVWISVSASHSSSWVPNPPGKMTNPSAAFTNMTFRA